MSNTVPRIRRSLFASALAVGLGAFALIPATASAHQTTFGSSLNHSPANAGSTCAQDGVTGLDSLPADRLPDGHDLAGLPGPARLAGLRPDRCVDRHQRPFWGMKLK